MAGTSWALTVVPLEQVWHMMGP